MEEMNVVVKELSRKYNKKEKLIEIMLEKAKQLGYNTIKSICLIENFIRTDKIL